MKKWLSQGALIIAVSLVLGLVVSFFGKLPESAGSKSDVLVGKTGRTVTLEEAYALNQSGDAGFIDSRPSEFFRREHIQSAISVPYSLPMHDSAIVSLDKNRTWIVYCKGPRCNQASILAQKLDRAGFSKVYLFPGGMEEWRLAQYPLERSE